MSQYNQPEDFQVFIHPHQIQSLWEDVCKKLKEDIGDAPFKSWIEPLKVISYDGNCLNLAAPSRFMKDWIQTHFGEQLLHVCQSFFPNLEDYTIAVRAAQKSIPREESPPPAPSPTPRVDPFASKNEPQDTTVEDYTEALDSRFTFENFVVGKSNELAYAAALRVAEADNPPFNPLFLYGGVGLGKTHLMHAIAWHLKKTHPKKRVIYISAEKFMYEFVRALRYKDTVAFKERFRHVDVLMIDDVQFISGKDTTQEEFFHTFNALVDNNHQVIISADKSPSDLEDMEERLRSRLGWGLVADIHPTTYELRLGILQAKADALKVNVSNEILEFLAVRITSNIRELEGALNRIVAHATLVGRRIDLDTTQDVLRDLLRSNDKRATIEDIQQKVCEYYNVRMTDLLSTRRLQTIAKPRQVAMYLAKTLTPKSLPEIGRRFGGRDHTTVLHAIRKIQENCTKDRDLANDVDILRRSLMA